MAWLDAGTDFSSPWSEADHLGAILQPDAPRYTILAVTDAYASCMRGPRVDLVGQGIQECLSTAAWPAARKNQVEIISSLERALASKQMNRIDLKAAASAPNVFPPLIRSRLYGSWVADHTPFLLPDGQVAYIAQSLRCFGLPDDGGRNSISPDWMLSSQFLKNKEITESLVQRMRKMQDATRDLSQTVRRIKTVMAKRDAGPSKLLGLLAAAENRERQAIARDLHDDLGQTLTAARIKLSAFLKPGNGVSKESALAEIDGLIAAAERSTRSLAAQLTPPMLYELGLVPALRWLFDELAKLYGLQVEFADDDEAKPLSQDARAILYRCIRELLINVAKHAQVQEALVESFVSNGHLVVSVCDEGVGFDIRRKDNAGLDTKPKLGLPSIAERLSYIGGSFNMVSQPGKGTMATLIAPLGEKSQLAAFDV